MALAPVITGSRLRLRPFVRADIGPAYLSWLNDPERMKFSRQREQRHDAASSASYLDGFAGSPHYFWAVEERDSGRLVGTMTAFFEGADADLGILIGLPGQGFGSEAWGLALDHLLRVEQRARARGGTAAGHVAMRRVCERWGMALEGETTPGIVRYAVTRDAWTGLAPGAVSR
jgi:RimJ/RimL family protein N-acetyltransferase